MRYERFFELVMELYHLYIKIAQDANTSKLALSNTSKSEIHF